jgi:hypothetical protein
MRNNRIARAGAYFTVPLCLFAYEASVSKRIKAIVAFGCFTAGHKAWSDLSDADRARWHDEWRFDAQERGFDIADATHCAMRLGAEMIGVFLPNVFTSAATLFRTRQFVAEFEARHGGRDATVRLKGQLVFEAREGEGMTPRELSVLAAVLSVIGRRRDPIRISRQTLIHRAMGYRSAAIGHAEIARRTDAARPLTEAQLRTTLTKLHKRRLFHRHTFGRRQTYYGIGMSKKEFRDKLVELKTKSAARELSDRLEANEIDAQIRDTRATMQGKPPINPEAGRGSVDLQPSA